MTIPVPDLPPTDRAATIQLQPSEEIEMDQLNPRVTTSGTASFEPTTPHQSIDAAERQMGDILSINSLRQMELKAMKIFFLCIIPLFLLPLSAIISILSYKKICLYYWSYPAEVCNDDTWFSPYAPIFFGVHSLVSPIMSLRLNQDFASPPSPIRRFRIYCLITICSCIVCVFFIVCFTFLFNQIPQSTSVF